MFIGRNYIIRVRMRQVVCENFINPLDCVGFEYGFHASGYRSKMALFNKIKRISKMDTQLNPKVDNYLDVGCGRGSFLKTIHSLGVESIGVEREDFQRGENEIYQMFYGELTELDLPEKSFDVITLWHVLEHLENPRDIFQYVDKIIKNEGTLVLSVPNFDSWQAKWFGRHWFHLDLPRHLYHYEQGWLCDVLKNMGYHPEVLNYLTLEQSIFGFIQSCQNLVFQKMPNELYTLLKKNKVTKNKVKFLFLATFALCLLPFALLEHAFSSLAGKNSSITVIAKKNNIINNN